MAKKQKKSKLTPMTWFVVLLVIADALALLLPPDPHTLSQLHISMLAYRIAIVSLLIPFMVLWYLVFYAYDKLLAYARYVKNSPEGKPYFSITMGMGVLAFGLVVPTIISLVLGEVTSHYQGFKTANVIIDNYIGIAVAVVAFTFISTGARNLVTSTRVRPNLYGLRVMMTAFLLLATVYTYLVLHAHTAQPGLYHLQTALLILTYILPYLYAWFAES